MGTAMKPIKVTRTHQMVLVGVSLLLALTSVSACAYIVQSGLKQWPEPELVSSNCTASLRDSGFEPVELEGALLVQHRSVDRIEQNVIQLGLSMPMCSEYKLATFCAGSQCAIPGITVNLVER